MKTPTAALLVSLSSSLLAAPAIASHPHDRVCVASVKLAHDDELDFTFEYEIGRTYKQGDANQDDHELALHARVCFEDYGADTCSYFQDAHVLPGGKKNDEPVAISLKDKAGKVFFVGTLTLKDEKLSGKIRGRDDDTPRTQISVTPTCVSQPLHAWPRGK